MNKTKDNINKTKNAVIVQSRINKAIQQEALLMEQQGFEVPSFSVSVKGDTRMDWKPEKLYVKVFHEYINLIEETVGLTVIEKGIIFDLSKYITYESNLLVTPKGIPLNRKDLENILGISHTAVDKYIRNLTDKSIIAKVKVGRSVQFYLNPRIAYMGNKIDNSLIQLFDVK